MSLIDEVQQHGESTIRDAIGAHEGAASNVAQLIEAGPPADAGGSGGLLGRILGAHRDTVQQGVQQTSGLDSDKTRKLLMMLAPVVLTVLARKHFGGANAAPPSTGQLGGALRQEAQIAAQQSPHAGGLLGKLLNAAEARGT